MYTHTHIHVHTHFCHTVLEEYTESLKTIEETKKPQKRAHEPAEGERGSKESGGQWQLGQPTGDFPHRRDEGQKL